MDKSSRKNALILVMWTRFLFLGLAILTSSQLFSQDTQERGERMLAELNAIFNGSGLVMSYGGSFAPLNSGLYGKKSGPTKSVTVDFDEMRSSVRHQRERETIESSLGIPYANAIKEKMGLSFKRKINLTLEHIRPLMLNGSNDEENLAITSETANKIKSKIESVFKSRMWKAGSRRTPYSLDINVSFLENPASPNESHLASNMAMVIKFGNRTLYEINIDPLSADFRDKKAFEEKLDLFRDKITQFLQFAESSDFNFTEHKPEVELLPPPIVVKAPSKAPSPAKMATPPVKKKSPSLTINRFELLREMGTQEEFNGLKSCSKSATKYESNESDSSDDESSEEVLEQKSPRPASLASVPPPTLVMTRRKVKNLKKQISNEEIVDYPRDSICTQCINVSKSWVNAALSYLKVW